MMLVILYITNGLPWSLILLILDVIEHKLFEPSKFKANICKIFVNICEPTNICTISFLNKDMHTY